MATYLGASAMHIGGVPESVATGGYAGWEWNAGVMTAMGVIAAVVVAVTLTIAVVRFITARRHHRN